MVRTVLLLLMGIGLGIGAERWVLGANINHDETTGSGSSELLVSAAAPQSGHILQRLADVEAAVVDEAIAREILQARIEEFAARLGEDGDFAPADASREAPTDVNTAANRREALAQRARRNSPEARVSRLTESGLEASLAQRMVERESELRRDILQQQFDSISDQVRAGEDIASARFRGGFSTAEALRAEFGDEQYDQYLYASGQNNRTQIFDVIPGTAAENSGVQVGDVLLRYDGQEIFAMSDLSRAQHDGSRGDDVVIEVLRNDQRLQLYVPRGPLGIQAARRARVAPDGM